MDDNMTHMQIIFDHITYKVTPWFSGWGWIDWLLNVDIYSKTSCCVGKMIHGYVIYASPFHDLSLYSLPLFDCHFQHHFSIKALFKGVNHKHPFFFYISHASNKMQFLFISEESLLLHSNNLQTPFLNIEKIKPVDQITSSCHTEIFSLSSTSASYSLFSPWIFKNFWYWEWG